MSDAVLRAHQVDVGYRSNRRSHVTILQEVDLELRPGSLVCLLGPNGAGKSTLLRTLVGAQRPMAGTVELGGRDIRDLDPRGRARRLSVVLTDRIDVGYLSALELVRLGRSPRSGRLARLGATDHEVVDWALQVAGATELAARQVHELSDGERQRVMIARALAQEPDVLVLDEPTAFLDLTRRVELMSLLRGLTTTTELAVLMSTHELELALRHADDIWLVHPDRRFQCGAPEDLAFAGDIGRAYAGTGIEFDDEAGTFTVRNARSELPVRVHGDERAARWAARAVVRAGWQPVGPTSGPVDVTLEVASKPDAIRWDLRTPGLDTRGSGCAALVEHLRGLDPR